jgi:hypothetical protein
MNKSRRKRTAARISFFPGISYGRVLVVLTYYYLLILSKRGTVILPVYLPPLRSIRLDTVLNRRPMSPDAVLPKKGLKDTPMLFRRSIRKGSRRAGTGGLMLQCFRTRGASRIKREQLNLFRHYIAFGNLFHY